MIFDFNVPYNAAGFVLGGPPPASFFQRAEKFVVHAINIPIHIIKAIVEIAKVFLLSTAWFLTFGQSKFILTHLIASQIEFARQSASIPISIIGLFAPINAGNWLHPRFNNPL